MLIVTYHAIARARSPIAVTAADLRSHVDGLLAAGFTFVTMDTCADWLARRIALDPRSVALTFDDGYRSVIEHAMPVLVASRVPAILYVIGGRLGGDNQWPGQWTGIDCQPLADAAALGEWVAAGFDVGGHSWTHARLPDLDDAALADEVDVSADRLEQRLGRPITHFAYPYGHQGNREVDAARRRYRTAVTTEVRAATQGSDPHRLPRIDGHDVGLALRAGLTNGRFLDWYLGCRRVLRRARRVMDGGGEAGRIVATMR